MQAIITFACEAERRNTKEGSCCILIIGYRLDMDFYIKCFCSVISVINQMMAQLSLKHIPAGDSRRILLSGAKKSEISNTLLHLNEFLCGAKCYQLLKFFRFCIWKGKNASCAVFVACKNQKASGLPGWVITILDGRKVEASTLFVRIQGQLAPIWKVIKKPLLLLSFLSLLILFPNAQWHGRAIYQRNIEMCFLLNW